ncbi:MAG TPA: ABC transporter substrate-binding protein [Acidimicrobiia bacterium]|nr:ABC transporter substrate-binding protein [Acidimicrobiia bacterium]
MARVAQPVCRLDTDGGPDRAGAPPRAHRDRWGPRGDPRSCRSGPDRRERPRRPGAGWSDDRHVRARPRCRVGRRPITGDDVVFTHMAIMSLEEPTTFDRAPYEAIVEIAGSADRVSITFDRPSPAHETIFPVVLPSHQMEDTDFAEDWNDEPWMSAGPFRVGWLEFDEFVFVPNEGYPGEGPNLDRLVFRYVPEAAELVDAFGRGEVDLILPGPDPDAVRRFGGAEGVDVAVQGGVIWEHLTFQFGDRNRNPGSLNAELDFRRAVAAALDVDALVDGLWLSDEAFTGLLDIAGLSSDEPRSGREPDLDEARALLDSLCERLGRDCVEDPPVVVVSSTSNGEARPVISQRIAEQLVEAGIEVRLELEDSAFFFGETLHGGTFDLGLWAWATVPGRTSLLATLEIYDPARPLLARDDGATVGGNYGRWGTGAVTGQSLVERPPSGGVDINQGPSSVIDEHTARYAEILAELRATADRSRFDELAREAEAILADQVVLIPLAARGHVSIVRGIAGYTPTPWVDTWNVEEWRVS